MHIIIMSSELVITLDDVIYTCFMMEEQSNGTYQEDGCYLEAPSVPRIRGLVRTLSGHGD